VADSVTTTGAAAGLADTAATVAADALVGAEDVLLGDTAMDAAASSGLGDAVAGVSTVVADAGVGALSFLPSWLVSGGLVALLGEAVFAVIALFAVLQAGASKGAEVLSSSGEDTSSKYDDQQMTTTTAKTAATTTSIDKPFQQQSESGSQSQINGPSSTGSYLDSLD
jgi:hypothetical protein